MREVRTLLLLHGGPGFEHSGFKPGLSKMAQYSQVVYPDLRGNGRSDAGPSAKRSLAQWALEFDSSATQWASMRRMLSSIRLSAS